MIAAKLLLILLPVKLLALDDPRLVNGAGGLPDGISSNQSCNCLLDDKFVAERSIAWQKTEELKLLEKLKDFSPTKKEQ